MFCRNCGKPISNIANECPYCKTKVNENVEGQTINYNANPNANSYNDTSITSIHFWKIFLGIILAYLVLGPIGTVLFGSILTIVLLYKGNKKNALALAICTFIILVVGIVWKGAFSNESDNIVTSKKIENKIPTYTITFDTDGGNSISPMTVNQNTWLTAPTPPKKSGYIFSGWDYNGEYFKFNRYVNNYIQGDITIKAIWEPEPSNNNYSNPSSNNSNSYTKTPNTTESKSSYIASCKDYNSQYEDMQRNPNSYKGSRMKFIGDVEQRWSRNGSTAAFTLSACTSDNFHIGEVYCEIDPSVLNGGNLLQYDRIIVYGEFKGLTENLYSIYGYANYPSLDIKYIEYTERY